MGFETEQTIRSRYAARLFKAKLRARAQYSNAAIAPSTVLSMVRGLQLGPRIHRAHKSFFQNPYPMTLFLPFIVRSH
jgi:hypothetical protein